MPYDEKWLRSAVNDGSTRAGRLLRPFLPNPDWQNAAVFIVGKNPATTLSLSTFEFEN